MVFKCLFCSLSFATSPDFIFDLQGGQSLMVKHLADMAPVEVEMAMAKVHKGDTAHEQKHPRVISLARGLERVIANLVAVWQIVNVVLFFPGVPARVARKVVIVTGSKVAQTDRVSKRSY